MSSARPLPLLAALVALHGGCGVERAPTLGAPCESDEDCAQSYFCGADPAAPEAAARVCVPEAACDPAAFEDVCAGRGAYSCLDGELTWTPCDLACEDGACTE